MVQAILEGRKTQTRRVIKPQPPTVERQQYFPSIGTWLCKAEGHEEKMLRCPYGIPGDRLWVKERGWMAPSKTAFIPFIGNENIHKPLDTDGVPYKSYPSIHMPRWASRLTLEIVSIKVERVQDISEEDAKAEGAQYATDPVCASAVARDCLNMTSPSYYRARFGLLWDSINAARGFGWDTNPWVYRIEFWRAD
jgi:hypothetical protein